MCVLTVFPLQLDLSIRALVTILTPFSAHSLTTQSIMRSFTILAAAVLAVSTPAFAAPHSARQVEYNGIHGGILGELPPVDPDCVHPTLQNFAKCIGPAIGRRAAADDTSGAIKLSSDVLKDAGILSSGGAPVVCARGLNEPRCCGACKLSDILFGGGAARRNYADGGSVARSAEELD